MTTFPNIGIVLPTRGPSGSGHWADTLDADLALIDAHDHQTGRGLPIRSAAITVDGDISFGSQWAITAMQRVSFAAVTALSANNKSLFCNTADNELYWRTNAGANVKLTSGSALNVGAFVGGIVGDYTAVSAALSYEDAAKRYKFFQGGGTTWARIQTGGVRIAELGTSETVFIEQVAPGALAGSYTMTWPTALPGATRTMLIDNTGQIIFGTTQTILVPISSPAIGATVTVQSVALSGSSGSGTATWFRQIDGLRVGDVITAVRARVTDSVTGPTKLTVALYHIAADGTLSAADATSSQSSGSGTIQNISVSPALTVTSATEYIVGVAIATGSASCSINALEVDVTR